MDVTADMGFLSLLLLASIRLGAIFLFLPLFSAAGLPHRVRILFTVTFAALLVSTLPTTGYLPPSTPMAWAGAALFEAAFGALLSFGFLAVFGAFAFGGRILDLQMGFGIANLIDPISRTQAPLIGTLLSFTAVAVFFLADGHHYLARALVASFQRSVPGAFSIDWQLDALVRQFGLVFTYGLTLVAPAVIALLLIDVGMAIGARTMPQLNVFFLGIPLKILVGLAVLALSVTHLGGYFDRAFASIFGFWKDVAG